MFRSLMTIIRELHLCVTKVIFMLKHSVKLRRYINLVMWQHAATSPNLYAFMICLICMPSWSAKGLRYLFI